MNKIDVIVPVKNEASNILPLVKRVDAALSKDKISYQLIFIVDKSTDSTIEEIKKASEKYPIRFQEKQGKPGKAFSIIEGAKIAQSDTLVMIDGDLQYPPEVISEMVAKSKEYGIVVANRVNSEGGKFRRLLSKINRVLVGKLLFGVNVDVQSGLKLFKKEVIANLDVSKIDEWSLDVPLIYCSLELGNKLGTVDITFDKRLNGNSKVNVVKTAKQIVLGAVKTRFSPTKVYLIPPTGEKMAGAGVVHQRKRFITHTTLHSNHSAINTFTNWQVFVATLFFDAIVLGVLINAQLTAMFFVALLSTVYFVDALFNLFLIFKSLHFPPELSFAPDNLAELKDKELPLYSILCPLYKEWQVLPQFIEAIEALDYPKDKLDVLLLLEENDKKTIEEASKMSLPKYFRTIIVPDSQPKTKPKACNYGLSFAKGEYIVIYDAEDKPESDQLKIAVRGFQKVPANVWCLQAKLNYYNPHHNILTRLFTAEYSLWFDVILTGLQSISTTIPLGGTSNHFRTKELLSLEGWDPFNVTEDCDLGIRLFKKGHKTAIIDSTTWEEANSNVGNWIRQRSRWIKGYIQTYLVHMRNPIELIKTQGIHALIFQLVVGGKIAFMVINPFLWVATVAYFVLYRFVGSAIESLYPAPIFYMAVFSLVFGNFLYLYYYMIGCVKRGHWTVVKYVYLIPFYWVLVSIAAAKAVVQLIVNPHYWEKTVHGFHLQPKGVSVSNAAKAEITTPRETFKVHSPRIQRIIDFTNTNFFSGAFLIGASLLGSFFNFLYNAYLSRNNSINAAEFGLVSLIGSFIYLSQVPISGISSSVTHHTAFLLGKFNHPFKQFWSHTRANAIKWSLVVVVVWIILSPFLKSFFQAESLLPFLLFAPVWVIGIVGAVDGGFLGGNLKFKTLATFTIIEAIAKFAITVFFIEIGQPKLIYASIPISMLIIFFGFWYEARKIAQVNVPSEHLLSNLSFPRKFFATSVLVKLTNIAYLGLDVIFVKHFLTPIAAGNYSILSLVGKMVFMIGSLFAQFILPMVSKSEGSGQNSNKTFNKLLLATGFASIGAFIGLGVFGFLTVPLLWGEKSLPILSYLPMYCSAMVCLTISGAIVNFHQIKKHNLFPIASFSLSLVELIGITLFHDSVYSVVMVMAFSAGLSVVTMFLFHWFYGPMLSLFRNLVDFLGVFGKLPSTEVEKDKLAILIFNWRDTKHVWSGGAEVYVHELAKRWVKMGHTVTVFCGNDGKNPRHDTIDGVDIVRRGGFFFVYIWAIAYYLLRFKGKYDVIIDSENGIPFFTPLYAKERKFLLIHHVHQEVFRKSLPYPGYLLASFLEQKLMPWAYRQSDVVTVSPSSKADILDHKLTQKEPTVIYNGVDLEVYKPNKKSENPMVLYLGRLKDHKSIPVFIQAAKNILESIPNVEFIIAGDGPDKKPLVQMVKELKLEEKVKFLGRVDDQQKVELLQKAWVFVNPSLMEGWGITNIEANACGTPVVASNVSGLRDSVHNPHSGFLVPYGNVEEFSVHIKKLIVNNKLRNEMSKDSIHWANMFGWDKSANNFISVLAKKPNAK